MINDVVDAKKRDTVRSLKFSIELETFDVNCIFTPK